MEGENDLIYESETDFYKKLRIKITNWLESDKGSNYKWANYLILAPDLFHLLCKLSTDKEVPAEEKAKLVLVIVYFISPIDLIPEAIFGPIGYAGDIVLSAYVLNSMLNNIDPCVIRRHWAGDDDILIVLQKILGAANEMVGGKIWGKIKRK